ncbi:response regulator [Wenyingzhuangia sp. IMCC45533]
MKKKVLYLENNAVSCLVMKKSLEKYAYIDTEQDMFSALSKSFDVKYDIFIIDLKLSDPLVDGFRFLEELESCHRKGIYIAYTGHVGDVWRDKCLNAGFDMYFSKPQDIKQMWEQIEEFCEQKQVNLSSEHLYR